MELLLLFEFELLLLFEFELLLLFEFELLLLDELEELLPATTNGFSAGSPAASGARPASPSGKGARDQPPCLISAGICRATAEPPASSAANAPIDANTLRFMFTAQHRPSRWPGLVGKLESRPAPMMYKDPRLGLVSSRVRIRPEPDQNFDRRSLHNSGMRELEIVLGTRPDGGGRVQAQRQWAAVPFRLSPFSLQTLTAPCRLAHDLRLGSELAR